jgi:hypothetical protein
MSDGMFLSACREVAREFPDVTYDEDLLDRACLQVCSLLRLDVSELKSPFHRSYKTPGHMLIA